MPTRRTSAKTRPKPKSRRPIRRDGEAKRDATRRTLLERALELFQQHGVDATTMRDIARAAGLSLGAAYYYFPSKEALVFAFYEDNQARVEELAKQVSGSVRDKLGAIFHGKLASIREHRAMLASIVAHLVNPGDPLSAFSAQTRDVRARAIAVFEHGLEGAELPAAAVPVVANALWLLTLASMLVYIHDDSPGEARTHQLVDDGLDMLVPMFPLLATPMGAALCERLLGALTRAGIQLAPAA